MLTTVGGACTTCSNGPKFASIKVPLGLLAYVLLLQEVLSPVEVCSLQISCKFLWTFSQDNSH